MNGNGIKSVLFSHIEPTQSDNLISLCFILIYLCEGSLPWIGLSDAVGKSMKEDSETVIHLTSHFADIPSQSALQTVNECLFILQRMIETRTILLGVQYD